MIVLMPTNPSDHGSACEITLVTGTGKYDVEMPKLPVKRVVVGTRQYDRQQILVPTDTESDLDGLERTGIESAAEVARESPRPDCRA